MLEITVWDQPRVQEEESEFLGEVFVRIIELLDATFGQRNMVIIKQVECYANH